MSCPICAKDSDAKYKPFCSRRCADVDLGKWLMGSYALPSHDADAGAGDDDTAESKGEGSGDASAANPPKPLRPV